MMIPMAWSMADREDSAIVRRPAAAGSTAGWTATASIRRPGASPGWNRTGWPRSGRGRGPANRRILYNRASADSDGKPWSERKALIWWDADKALWTGHDIPDFRAAKSPHYRPPTGATGAEALAGIDPSSCRLTASRGCSSRLG
jgi:formate dehydrogenase major subunit